MIYNQILSTTWCQESSETEFPLKWMSLLNTGLERSPFSVLPIFVSPPLEYLTLTLTHSIKCFELFFRKTFSIPESDWEREVGREEIRVKSDFQNYRNCRIQLWNLSDTSITNQQYLAAWKSQFAKKLFETSNDGMFFWWHLWLNDMWEMANKTLSANLCKTLTFSWPRESYTRCWCQKTFTGIVDDRHPPGAKVNTKEGRIRKLLSGILTNTWGVGQVANIADGIDSYAPGLKKKQIMLRVVLTDWLFTMSK